MADPVYSVSDIVDKTLFAAKDLPYFDSQPTAYSTPKSIGIIKAGTPAGVVYSWLETPQGIWWMFYPSNTYGHYYYMPHHIGDFDMNALAQQGVLSEPEKAAAAAEENKTWYEKLIGQILPVAAIVYLGGVALKGYISKKL